MSSIDNNNKIIIATRCSQLALWQSHWVAEQIKKYNPNITIELLKITTKGDKILDKSLAKIGGKGLFVKELEQALLDKKADIAVHSLKDMPAVQPDGLELSVYCPREDYHDVLVSKNYKSLDEMPVGAKIGTASVRRAAQLKLFRNDLDIITLRGSVDTRINKALADDTVFDGIILAAAGVIRIEKEYLIRKYLNISQFLPAPGQGIVTIETRSDDINTKNLIKPLACEQTTIAAKAEREFNYIMGGSCQVPIAAHATIDDDENTLSLRGQVATPDGSSQVTAHLTGSIKNPIDLGEQLARKILSSGGESIIKSLNLL